MNLKIRTKKDLMRIGILGMIVLCFAGCSVMNDNQNSASPAVESDNHNTGVVITPELLKQNEIVEISNNTYAWEGDIIIDENMVRTILSCGGPDSKGNMYVNSSGNIVKWNDADKRDLSYTFSGDFSAYKFSDAQVKEAFRNAVKKWMAAADIYIYEKSSGGRITVKSTRSPSISPNNPAWSNYPYISPQMIEFHPAVIDSAYDSNAIESLFLHEFGHTLGLVHEHQRPDSPDNEGQGVKGRSYGPYDPYSIMNYLNDSSYSDRLSWGDKAVISYLYGGGCRGYIYAGFVGYVYKNYLPGTRALYRLCKSFTQDHILTVNAFDEATKGYVFDNFIGYIDTARRESFVPHYHCYYSALKIHWAMTNLNDYSNASPKVLTYMKALNSLLGIPVDLSHLIEYNNSYISQLASVLVTNYYQGYYEIHYESLYPLFRFYHGASGDEFYTTDTNEIFLNSFTYSNIQCPVPAAPYSDARKIIFSAYSLGFDLIKTLRFDGSTVFSAADKPVAGDIFEKGKNPGLAVRNLTSNGITGSGVTIGMIDQILGPDALHPDYNGKILSIIQITGVAALNGSKFGPTALSLSVGSAAGTAPGAKIWYAAVPEGTTDAKYYAQALDLIIASNRILPPDSKIRLVCVPSAPSADTGFTNPVLWTQAVLRAAGENILVLDSGEFSICHPGYLDMNNPNDITKFITSDPVDSNSLNNTVSLYTPSFYRTTAELYIGGSFGFQYSGLGGKKWAVPYAAGVLALGWQVNPNLSIAKITNYLFNSAYTTARGLKVINPTNFVKTIQNNIIFDGANDPGTLWISPSSVRIINGNCAVIEVHVNTGSSVLSSYNIDLTFDSTVLEFLDVSYASGSISNCITTIPGKVTLSGINSAAPNTDLTILRLNFRGIGRGISQVDMKVNSLLDPGGSTVGKMKGLGGSISVN